MSIAAIESPKTGVNSLKWGFIPNERANFYAIGRARFLHRKHCAIVRNDK
jgi:hypothetical protein